MPPDPILALLSLIALAVYIAIGSVVAAVAIRQLGSDEHAEALQKRKFSGKIGSYRNSAYAGNVWSLFFLLSLVWPIVIGATVVSVIAVLVFYGPVWLAVHTGSYVANIGEGRAA